MIEQQLEAGIIEMMARNLQASHIDGGVLVTGSWSQVTDGDAKGIEKPKHSVVIAVAVGAPEWDQYLSPVCSIPVALSIAVRCELAPTGARLAEVMQPIAALLMEMQCDVDSLASLTTDTFSADGLRLDGGSAPQFDREANKWYLTRSFTVRGVPAQPYTIS